MDGAARSVLIKQSAGKAIRRDLQGGKEEITRSLMDEITLDYRSETEYAESKREPPKSRWRGRTGQHAGGATG